MRARWTSVIALLVTQAQRPAVAQLAQNPTGSTEPGSNHAAVAAREATDQPRTGETHVGTDPNTRVPSRDVELHAGHVEIEGPLNRLSLSKGVDLTVHRYHVTAERLNLERTPHGILVQGDGSVGFCPCVDPPLTIGFTRSTVAPPTDLLLRNATFRVCSLPVFWLPAFWIRSPNKLGLSTPQLGWRGKDGPWLSAGMHAPLSPKSPNGDTAVEALLGVYLRGGVDLGLHLKTTRSVSRVRWDYVGSGFAAVESSGHWHTGKQFSVSWDIDALRGARGRAGSVAFETATRSYDRFRSEFALADGRALYALSFHADVGRSTTFSSLGQFGPAARWSVGAQISDYAHVDSTTTLFGRLNEQAHALALHVSELGVDARPGPMVARWTVHERWLLASGSQGTVDAALLGTEVRLGLPLVAALGEGPSTIGHWLEPFVLANAAVQGWGDSYANPGVHVTSTLQVGVSNKFGAARDPAAISLQLRGGSVSERGDTHRAIAGRWLSSAEWFAFGGDCGFSGTHSWLSTLRSRVGRIDRVALRSRLEGRSSSASRAIDWLLDEAWSPWKRAWFSRPGWLIAEDIDVAVGH
ncbi:MAG: hypothetical protein ACM3ZE_12565, partial [Myxococcales bacterium]